MSRVTGLLAPQERPRQTRKPPRSAHLSQRFLLATRDQQEVERPKTEEERKQRRQKLGRRKRRQLQHQEGRDQKTQNGAASPQKSATRRRATAKRKTMRSGLVMRRNFRKPVRKRTVRNQTVTQNI